MADLAALQARFLALVTSGRGDPRGLVAGGELAQVQVAHRTAGEPPELEMDQRRGIGHGDPRAVERDQVGAGRAIARRQAVAGRGRGQGGHVGGGHGSSGGCKRKAAASSQRTSNASARGAGSSACSTSAPHTSANVAPAAISGATAAS